MSSAVEYADRPRGYYRRPMSENVRGTFHKKVVTPQGIYSLVPAPVTSGEGPSDRFGLPGPPALWVMADGQPDRPDFGDEWDRLIMEGHHEPRAAGHVELGTVPGYDQYRHEGLNDHLFQPLTWN